MIGFDTSAIIDLFNNDEKLKELLVSLDDSFCSTIINYQELIFGLDIVNKSSAEEYNFYESLFENFKTFLCDKNSCNKSGEIYQYLRKNGKMIDDFDCMIAGIFLFNGVNKIITRNVKHFERIPGVKVLSY